MLLYLLICVVFLVQSTLGNNSVRCGDTYSNHTGVIIAITTILRGQGHNSHRAKNCSFFVEAPKNHLVTLNFTNFIGFWHYRNRGSSQSGRSKKSCDKRPRVEILEVILPKGTERPVRKICPENISPSDVPYVFQSSLSLIKVSYVWDGNDYSGFTVKFRFKQKTDNCKFRCKDGTCLPLLALVCNAMADCPDASDEAMCAVSVGSIASNVADGSSSINTANNGSSKSNSETQQDASHLVQIFAIVLVVVIVIAILTCVVSYMHRTSRFVSLLGRASDRCLGDSGASSEHNRLHPASSRRQTACDRNSSQTPTEVVYVPDLRLEREMQSNQQRHLLMQSNVTAMDLALPPNIPLTEDGEEGYKKSQKHLLKSCDPNLEISRESVRPPPNISVGDSPPAYRSNSLEKNPAVDPTFDPTFGNKGHRIVRDGQGNTVQMPRCNSLSLHHNNNYHPQHQHYNHSHNHLHANHHHHQMHHSMTCTHPPTHHRTNCNAQNALSGRSPIAGAATTHRPPPSYRDVVTQPQAFKSKVDHL